MKAVILAAGQGSRIREHHQYPKGFLQLGDQPIILDSIAILKAHGINDIALVTGYGTEHYEQLATNTQLFTTIYNPLYASANSLYSWFIAQQWLDNDFLLLESDLIYEPSAITTLLSCPDKTAILLSGPTHSGDEVYVQANNQQLVAMSKDHDQLDSNSILGEFVGINKLEYSVYLQLITLLNQNQELLHTGHYEEQGLVALSQHHPIACQLIPNLAWGEIDNWQHLQRAQKIYASIYKGS